jgi:hypothetical protein
MKRFRTIVAFWAACFVLLFLFYFVSDFYVIVGSGPGSWRKSTPLSFGERCILSFVGATVVTAAIALVAACTLYLYRATRYFGHHRRAASGSSTMVFAFATDERMLHVFRDAAAATAHAEGIDVEDGVWLFFSENGAPLQPSFTVPNKRGPFTVISGEYSLQPSHIPSAQHLLELLPNVAAVEGELESIQGVRQVLTTACSG